LAASTRGPVKPANGPPFQASAASAPMWSSPTIRPSASRSGCARTGWKARSR